MCNYSGADSPDAKRRCSSRGRCARIAPMPAAPSPAGRLQQLQKMLEAAPDDTFLLYGIGMEYKKAGDPERAVEHFNRVLQIDPGYCYAYYQRGQTAETTGD